METPHKPSPWWKHSIMLTADAGSNNFDLPRGEELSGRAPNSEKCILVKHLDLKIVILAMKEYSS